MKKPSTRVILSDSEGSLHFLHYKQIQGCFASLSMTGFGITEKGILGWEATFDFFAAEADHEGSRLH